MKLKKSTWFLLCLAISLGIWVYFYEIKLESQKIVREKQEKKIFNFDIKNIQKITITRPIQTSPEWQSIKLKKTQNTSPSWWIEQGETFPANPGVISFLLNLIEQDASDRKLLITPEQLSQYGLDRPIASINIQLDNQQNHLILLGKETINPDLIYAQIKPTKKDVETTEIVLVSKNWHYAVIRDFKEWKDFSQ